MIGPSSRLKGKVAIVTGGGRGVGRATALALAEEGAKVVVIARTKSEIDSVANEIRSSGGEALSIPMDISQKNCADIIVSETLQHFGRVDIIVNNAAITSKSRDVVEPDEWDKIMEINLKAAFLFSQAAVPIMKNLGSGYIVNISSLSGKTGHAGDSGGWGVAPYISSKFGMVGLSRYLAWITRKDNINVTVICPGNIDTRMASKALEARKQEEASGPRMTFMKPSEIAEIILFLVTRSHNVIIPEVMVFPRYHENFVLFVL